MAFIRGQSAVIVPIREADRLVGPWRERFDPAAALAVPAHVTLIYPFIDVERLTRHVVGDLARLVAGHPSFDVTFAGCAAFPEIVYLAPTQDARFRRLTEDLARHWPEAPPYAGAFPDPIPHLTIMVGAPPGDAAQAEVAVAAGLPLTVRVAHAELITFDGTMWSLRAILPLGEPDD